MLVSGGSPEEASVDAARDSKYCPQEPHHKPPPRAAPRGNPPTPKPRSGNFKYHFFFLHFSKSLLILYTF